jgi:hypothetical protein
MELEKVHVSFQYGIAYPLTLIYLECYLEEPKLLEILDFLAEVR